MEWKLLAGLRFFLAWIVFCCHLIWFVPANNVLLKFDRFSGVSAVLGFLLISGYSIANSISRKPKGFYKRRVLRIYPLYFSAVVLSIVAFIFSGKNIQLINIVLVCPDLLTFLGNLLFLQGFVCQTVSSNLALWTLSIEFLCYLLAPVFIKMSNKHLGIIIVVSAVSYAIYPFFHLPHYSLIKFGLNFLFFSWAWVLGFFYFRNKEKSYAEIMLIVTGCLAIELNYRWNDRFSTVTYILSSLVLIYSPYIRLSQTLNNIFKYMGDISYPFYLFHLPTLVFLYAVIGVRNSLVLVFLSLLTATFFYHTLDFYSRQRSL